MSGNKIIFKNTIILYVKLILSAIIGLLTSRFTINALGLSDYGLYSVVGGVVVVFSFINTIMIAATYRFIAFEIGKGEHGEVNKIFNICFNIHVILAIFVIVLNEFLGVYYVKNYLNTDLSKIDDAIFVLRLSGLATSFSILSIPHQSLLTAHENFFFRSMIEIGRSLIGLIIALFLLHFFGNKLKLFALLIAFANILPTISYFIYCRLRYVENVKFRIYKDYNKYKEILTFTGWNILGAASVVGQSVGTPLIINNFFGTTMNAAFSIGSQVRGIISQFAMNLAQAAVPQITKNYSSGDSKRAINIVAYTSKYTWFLMLFPTLPLLLETKFLLNVWLINVPDFAISFTRLLIVLTLVNGLGNGIGSIIQAIGKIKYFELVLSTTTLIGLPIGYFFYHLGYSATSIIYIYIVTGLTNAFVVQILLNKLMNFNVKYFVETSYLRILYVLISLTPLGFLLQFMHEGFFRVAFTTIISIIWLSTSIYYLGLDCIERKHINDFLIIKKKILFKQN
jgi:O-antigen/teichoic acid export membrane protein